jgi:acyl-CoA reductase-like NAD-dependent aldehyde dehydrogenase
MPNFGQVCIAPDYVLCHESKVDEFIESLKLNLQNAYGNCETPADSGKIVNEFHYNRLCDLFKDHGGEIIIGNKNTYEDRDLKPTLILNPDKNSELMKDEIFGPIFPLISYKNIDEAINYVQDLEKPLVVYYFG